MKRVYITTILTCVLMLLVIGIFQFTQKRDKGPDSLKVGFIYENDESTPYTYNFSLAAEALKEEYQDRIQILTRSNVPEKETETPARDLVQNGCQIIFCNSYSSELAEIAKKYPEVQFCQTSYLTKRPEDYPANYHTFNGEIYQGRYVSGVVAGLQLRQLLDTGRITADEALVGYVAAYPTAAVISGYTAFLLGIRSVAPEATMSVRYINTWGNYTLEKECAEALIDDGCIVISQHSDTIGPAVACEEHSGLKPIYFVGYNQSMLSVAPTTALVSTRINWIPYVVQAVGAVFAQAPIEEYVDARDLGGDMSGGFGNSWVEMLDLNNYIAVPDSAQKMEQAISGLSKGSIQVYKGDYTGVNPNDSTDRIDLKDGYIENEFSSAPSFGYVLDDVITIK